MDVEKIQCIILKNFVISFVTILPIIKFQYFEGKVLCLIESDFKDSFVHDFNSLIQVLSLWFALLFFDTLLMLAFCFCCWK
jgi:hypothetical protein